MPVSRGLWCGAHLTEGLWPAALRFAALRRTQRSEVDHGKVAGLARVNAQRSRRSARGVAGSLVGHTEVTIFTRTPRLGRGRWPPLMCTREERAAEVSRPSGASAAFRSRSTPLLSRGQARRVSGSLLRLALSFQRMTK